VRTGHPLILPPSPVSHMTLPLQHAICTSGESCTATSTPTASCAMSEATPCWAILGPLRFTHPLENCVPQECNKSTFALSAACWRS
jgi:hypothetical protein